MHKIIHSNLVEYLLFFQLVVIFLISKRILNERKAENKFNCSIFSWLVVLILLIHSEYFSNTGFESFPKLLSY